MAADRAAHGDAAMALEAKPGIISEPPVLPPAVKDGQDTRTPDEVMEEILASGDNRERFIPVSRSALIDRLTRPHTWREGQAKDARRLFLHLDNWRQVSYSAKLLEMGRLYDPFNPDSDLLLTRKFAETEKRDMQAQLITHTHQLLGQANYTRIDPSQVELILTKESHYGLDLQVDLEAFDELLIYYRGATKRRHSRRDVRRLYLYREEYDVPIFQRLFVLFKLKPEAKRAREVMEKEKCDYKSALRIIRKRRGAMGSEIKDEAIYLKLFKSIPRSDIEMCFPNTCVKFKLFDKLRLGVTAGGGLGMGVVGTVTKLAVATNPIALAGAVAGLGGIAIRQATNFLNKRNQYMVTMAQNLYLHALADNRGVMTLLGDRAAEEDFKEEVLLYSVLAKEPMHVSELADVDAAVEQWLLNTFGLSINFDLEDAFARLLADGLVKRQPDGWLVTMPPAEAARHIDKLWDGYLDNLPDPTRGEGIELEDEPLA